MSQEVHHPIFARVFERVAAKEQEKGQAEHRAELVAGLNGRVIEVGAGHGLNFSHYPSTVSEVLAVEPEDYLRQRAAEAAAKAEVKITVVDGLADALPAEDASFDAGVASLVLCSIGNPGAALAELYRVIRPGGELRFYEHVISEKPGFARFQRAVTPVWKHLAGGCHADRDTKASIKKAGFEIEQVRSFPFRASVLVLPATPHVLGVARRPPAQ
jgi:ubiquinone/menaquinone biosynthesis C-methylase UbiE